MKSCMQEPGRSIFRIGLWVVSLSVLCCSPAPAAAGAGATATEPPQNLPTDSPARAPAPMTLHLSRSSGPENGVFGLFDSQTGNRVARIQIARITLDYGKEGHIQGSIRRKI